MVRIRKKSKKSLSKEYLPIGFVIVATVVVLWLYPRSAAPVSLGDLNVTKSSVRGMTSEKETSKTQEEEKGNLQGNSDSTNSNNNIQCPITRIADLKPEEQHPVAGSRHMVTPPEGGSQHLVCCTTSKGPFTVLVHEKWAPNGAQRFLDMVKNGYFDSTVPLMRCVKGFLCQFGLNSDPNKTKLYRQRLDDDPNWLPEGPTNRQNEQGVYRFAQGYLAYAGSGKNSRTNQLIISLQHQQFLAGGSPWEVPWGEIVGEHSFETWSKVYTGYGEKGPGQGKLINNGMTDEMRKEFPELDYITGCSIVDQIMVE